jgi:hypothetical protein
MVTVLLPKRRGALLISISEKSLISIIPGSKTEKKACQNFLYPIKPWGNHPELRKSVDALVAAPLQTTLHTQNSIHIIN